MSKEPDPICDKCQKPVRDGQAAYCGLVMRGIHRHWSCHEKAMPKDVLYRSFEQNIEKLRGIIEALKRRHK